MIFSPFHNFVNIIRPIMNREKPRILKKIFKWKGLAKVVDNFAAKQNHVLELAFFLPLFVTCGDGDFF